MKLRERILGPIYRFLRDYKIVKEKYEWNIAMGYSKEAAMEKAEWHIKR